MHHLQQNLPLILVCMIKKVVPADLSVQFGRFRRAAKCGKDPVNSRQLHVRLETIRNPRTQ